MAHTTEQKRRMRIARKKRKKLQQREAMKAKWDAKPEIATRLMHDESRHHKQLASTYCSLWRKCIQQNKELQSQLLGKQYGRVSAMFNLICCRISVDINVYMLNSCQFIRALVQEMQFISMHSTRKHTWCTCPNFG